MVEAPTGYATVVNGTAEVPEHRLGARRIGPQSQPTWPEFVDAPFPAAPDDAATIAFGSDLRAAAHARPGLGGRITVPPHG